MTVSEEMFLEAESLCYSRSVLHTDMRVLVKQESPLSCVDVKVTF